MKKNKKTYILLVGTNFGAEIIQRILFQDEKKLEIFKTLPLMLFMMEFGDRMFFYITFIFLFISNQKIKKIKTNFTKIFQRYLPMLEC